MGSFDMYRPPAPQYPTPTNTGVTGGTLGSVQPAPSNYVPPGILYGGGASAPTSGPNPLDAWRAAGGVGVVAPPSDPRAQLQPQSPTPAFGSGPDTGMYQQGPDSGHLMGRTGTLGSIISTAARQLGGSMGNRPSALSLATSPQFLQQLAQLFPQLNQNGMNGLPPMTGSGYGGGTQRPGLPRF